MGIKITLETPLRYTYTVQYGEVVDGVAHKIAETFNPNLATYNNIERVSVWRNTDNAAKPKVGLVFWIVSLLGYMYGILPYVTRWRYSWNNLGEREERTFIRRNYGSDSGYGEYEWDRIEPSYISSEEVYGAVAKELIIGNARLYVYHADLNCNGNEIVFTPQCFGVWETTEDVLLSAVAPESLKVPHNGVSLPDQPTLTYGRARIRVEPYYSEEQ